MFSSLTADSYRDILNFSVSHAVEVTADTGVYLRLNTFEVLMKFPEFILIADVIDHLPTTTVTEDVRVQAELQLSVSR